MGDTTGHCPYCGAQLTVVVDAVAMPVKAGQPEAKMLAIREELEHLRQLWEADAGRLMVRGAAGHWVPPPKERDGFKFVVPFGILGLICFMAFPIIGSQAGAGMFAGGASVSSCFLYFR